MVHFYGMYLFGFLPQLNFFLLLSIPLSCFSWFPRTFWRVFHTSVDVFHWSLSDSKSFQVYRTLLHILSDLNYAVVRMVFTFSLIFKSSSPFTNRLVFSINLMTLSNILYILRQSIIQFCRTILYLFWLHFLVSFGSLWRCVDQCIVDLFLFLICSIISVLLGTVCGLLASSKSPTYFLPLIGPLLVYNFWEQFLFGGLFGSGWPFLLSSIWVYLYLLSIY